MGDVVASREDSMRFIGASNEPLAGVAGGGEPLATGDVFVIVGAPTETFVDRKNDDPEVLLRRALSHQGALISLTGQTKSGKTVVCRRLLPLAENVWLDGGSIKNERMFWQQVVTELAVPTAEVVEEREKKRTQKEFGFGLFRKLLGLADVGPSFGISTDNSSETSKTGQIQSDVSVVGKKALLASGKTLIVDDFHLIPTEAHGAILSALKAPIDEGLKCVLVSIPERGFDASEAVPDMQGRIDTVPVEPWSESDLVEIAMKGFASLNVVPSQALVKRIAKEAQGSPQLVQLCCRELCYLNGINARQLQPTKIKVTRYEDFFSQVASRTPDSRVRKLIGGRMRQMRLLRNGRQADIYEVVLLAIRDLLPKRVISYKQVFDRIEDHCQRAPRNHEIRQVFEKMDTVAANEIEGQPVFYDLREKQVIVLEDPYLNFFIKWGDWFQGERAR